MITIQTILFIRDTKNPNRLDEVRGEPMPITDDTIIKAAVDSWQSAATNLPRQVERKKPKA